MATEAPAIAPDDAAVPQLGVAGRGRRRLRAEREAVMEVLHSERVIDFAPLEITTILEDEGTCLCSARTMYRLLAEPGELRDH